MMRWINSTMIKITRGDSRGTQVWIDYVQSQYKLLAITTIAHNRVAREIGTQEICD